MTSPRRYLIIGFTILAALLAALIVPNFRRGAASLAHPDPVGPTAYSKSAIGHGAFLELLRQLDIPASISELGSGAHTSTDDVLLVAEPRADESTLAEVGAMLDAPRTVLLVLPKRAGKPAQDKPYWLAEDKLLSAAEVASVLHLVDKEATLLRGASLDSLSGVDAIPGSPAIQKPQLINSKKLRPLLEASGGILIGERRTGNRRLVVLSDPDLIANHGLARGDNSVIAVGLIRYLRGQNEDSEVVFDEFIHGFSPKPFHLLGILFQFPFVLVTLQMAVAVALLAWAATARFGAPAALAAPIEAGKLSLIDTGARLLAQTGRIPDLSERYFEEMVRDTGRRLRAPVGQGSDLPTLVAWLNSAGRQARPSSVPSSPQEIWNWRKELIGEPRPRTNVD